MKVSPIIAQQMIGKTYKTSAKDPVQGNNAAGRKDEVELSDSAKTFASAVREVKQQIEDPAARQAKIDSVTSQMEAGTYSIDSRMIAQKILGR